MPPPTAAPITVPPAADAAPVARTAGKLAELALTHLATFAFPLVFAVVCGRTLGIGDYGIVSFYTALGGLLGILIEFGFDWYGIRAVAQSADAAQRHRELWNITATKLVLYLAVITVAAVVVLAWRGVAEWPLLAGTALFLLGFAFDAAWYMRALEQTRALLVITACVRLLGIAALLIVVPRLATKESALWAYGAVSLLTSALTWGFLARRRLMAVERVDARRVAQLLRGSSAIVLGNLNAAVMTHGGIVLLATMAEPAVVGAANLALRVRTASHALLLPIQQLGFVRLSARAGRDPAGAVALGRRLLAPTLGVAVVVAAVCVVAAEPISRFVFKADVPLAALMIVLLALTGPIQAAANLFGSQSLIAFGRERDYALIQGVASGTFLAVLWSLPPETALGWALGAGEAVVAVLAGLGLRRIAGRSTDRGDRA